MRQRRRTTTEYIPWSPTLPSAPPPPPSAPPSRCAGLYKRKLVWSRPGPRPAIPKSVASLLMAYGPWSSKMKGPRSNCGPPPPFPSRISILSTGRIHPSPSRPCPSIHGLHGLKALSPPSPPSIYLLALLLFCLLFLSFLSLSAPTQSFVASPRTPYIPSALPTLTLEYTIRSFAQTVSCSSQTALNLRN